MTVRKVITIYNFPRRVPVTEIYSAISRNFRITYTDGAGQSSIEVAAVQSSVGAGWVTVLPEPVVLKVVWISSELLWHHNSRFAVWRQYPRPDRAVGVVTVHL